MSIAIYIDGDACPVKDETYKVADRHRLPVYIVANKYLRIPPSPRRHFILVEAGPDIADDYIAERAHAETIIVTADILLAERCLNRGAAVLAPNGKPFTSATIGAAVATRALMDQLRSTGDISGGAPPFRAADRSRFLQALHEAIVKLRARTG